MGTCTKGQRTLIHYANGAETTYAYDDQTFRLMHLKTTRTPGQNALDSQLFTSATTVQDLHYTYDPAGNITRIEDAALLTIFHNGEKVEPVCNYTYDAIYRLIKASGREHIGQTAFDSDPPSGNFRDYPFAGLTAHSNDIQALRNYTEQYEYEAVGNFEKLIHQAANGNWTRVYAYSEASLAEFSTKTSNRLSGTTIGQTTKVYTYDAHGNMTKMPHLTLMQWDCKDQLHATSGQATNNGAPETTFYVYDASGQRVRKVTERQNGTRKDERIYLGGFEMYHEYNGSVVAVTLERETLHVMDDKQRIALVETKTLDSAPHLTPHTSLIRYQLANHLGSASLELDKEGGLISYEEYHPYGTTAYQAMDSAAEVSLKRYRYTGKERDEETGLYYHVARYYASWLGRWTAADPVGIKDAVNVFSYAWDNPIIIHDPSGTANKPANETEKTVMQKTDAQHYRYLKNLERRSPSELAQFSDSTTGWFRKRTEGMINKYGMAREYPSTITASKSNSLKLKPETTPAAEAATESGVDVSDGPVRFTLVPNPFSKELPPTIRKESPEGYAYKTTFYIADVNEFVNEKTVMRLMQRDPGKIFPFKVKAARKTQSDSDTYETIEGPAVIENGAALDLQGPRTFFIPFIPDALDSGNYVTVEKVTETQFTFRAQKGHFDWNSVISFRTHQKEGKVYLEQTAWARNTGGVNVAVAPPGATRLAWPAQAENLRREVNKADPLHILRPLMSGQRP